MKTYGVKDHEFVNPFTAKDNDEAAGKALKILGFDWVEAHEMIKRHGNLKTLKLLNYELKIL